MFKYFLEMIPVEISSSERDIMHSFYHDPEFREIISLHENLTNAEVTLEFIPQAQQLGDSSESTDVVNVNQNANSDGKTGISFHHPTVLMTLAVISVFVLMAALIYAFGKIKSLKHKLAMTEHRATRGVGAGAPIQLGANQAGHRNIYDQPMV